MPEEHTLITNLSYVKVGDVRTRTFALLLSKYEGRYTVRGFGVDPAWETFDIRLTSTEYSLTNTEGDLLTQIRRWGTSWNYGSGLLQFVNGPRLELWISSSEKPIRVDPPRSDIREVWAVLPGLVRYYWSAPNMPTIFWGPK